MKLLVDCQRIIICVMAEMCNYCFIRVSDYMLVFVMVFVSRFVRSTVRNMVAGYRRILCKGYGLSRYGCRRQTHIAQKKDDFFYVSQQRN